jgi:hypothetical protein
MDDLKKKALTGIKGMLEERMVARMKPSPKHEDTEMEESPMEEAGESPDIEASEEAGGEHGESGMGGDLKEKIAGEGGDLSKLTPEEQQQLQHLYDKMGC